MSTQKNNLIQAVLANITAIGRAANGLTGNVDTFIDRGYKSDGTDPITDADLLPFGLTLAKFTEAKVLIDNFNLFLDGVLQPAQKDYRKIINNLKTVS